MTLQVISSCWTLSGVSLNSTEISLLYAPTSQPSVESSYSSDFGGDGAVWKTCTPHWNEWWLLGSKLSPHWKTNHMFPWLEAQSVSFFFFRRPTSVCLFTVSFPQVEPSEAPFRQVLCCTLTWGLPLSAVPVLLLKERGKQLLQWFWKDLDMNGKVLTGRFRQTSSPVSPATWRPQLFVCVKLLSRRLKAPRSHVTQNKCPSVLLYLQLSGEIKWGNAAPLTWYVCMQIPS